MKRVLVLLFVVFTLSVSFSSCKRVCTCQFQSGIFTIGEAWEEDIALGEKCSSLNGRDEATGAHIICK